MTGRMGVVGGVLGALVGAAVVACVVAFFVLAEAYRIPSASMAPTLEEGDRVAVLRFKGPIDVDVGDIVAYEAPEAAGRECGVPGDAIYIHRIARRAAGGRLVMRGDNAAVACDSRAFGPVPRGSLIGEVVVVYWPPKRWGLR